MTASANRRALMALKLRIINNQLGIMGGCMKQSGQTETRKTARPLAISSDDTALILESLRIAASDIRSNALRLELLWPGSPLVERFRIAAESMDVLRNQLETR